MTAPPGDRGKVFRKWCSWLDVVTSELVRANYHRQMWAEVRDAIVEHHPNASAHFIISYSRVYITSQMSLVRRLAEDDPKNTTASLGTLVRSVREQRDVMNRERYVHIAHRHGRTTQNAIAEWEQLWATPGDLHISRRLLDDDYRYLTRGLEPIVKTVHKLIAHLDQTIAVSVARGRRPRNLPSVAYGDVHGALDRLGEITNRYRNLMRRNTYGTWYPHMSGDWKAPFRGSLFPR